MRRITAFLGMAAGAGLLAAAPDLAARSIIKQPGNHTDYEIEAEPHANFGPLPFPGKHGDKGPRFGIGPGFRATFELVDNGFITRINNTVGLGLGGDLIFGKDFAVWVPVVMQWNFFLSEDWSVFAEPGGGMIIGKEVWPRPVFYAGARWHVAETVTFTLRAGYPSFSAGVSFLL